MKLLEAALEEARRGELREVMIIGKGPAGSITSYLSALDWMDQVAYMERLKYRLMKGLDEIGTMTDI